MGVGRAQVPQLTVEMNPCVWCEPGAEKCKSAWSLHSSVCVLSEEGAAREKKKKLNK